MIEIKLNQTKLVVPESWNDIKLADYEKWYLKQPTSKIEYIRLISEVCKIDYDLLMNSPTSFFDTIVNAINFVFESNITPECSIVIDGIKYYVSNSETLTLGEWVDVESVLNGDSESKLSEILAILCRPASEDYDTNLFESRRRLFSEQSCEQILPLITFFLLKKKRLDAISNHYSEAITLAKQYVQGIEHFVENGDGIKQLPIWQRIRFIYLMRSLKKQLAKFLDSSYIV